MFIPELKKDLAAGVPDPLVNISEFEDKTLDEDYGSVVTAPSNTSSGNIVHQNMIKRYKIYSPQQEKIEDKKYFMEIQLLILRFNQHSIMVLKACERNSKDGHTGFVTSDGMLAVENNPHPKTDIPTEVEENPSKKKVITLTSLRLTLYMFNIFQISHLQVRLQEKITYDDLSREDSQDNVPSKSLQLTKVEFHHENVRILHN